MAKTEQADGGVTVIARMQARPGERDALVEACRPAITAAGGEDGTLEYVLHLDTGNEDVVWFYERYRDRVAFDEHRHGDAMRDVGRALQDLLAGRPELTFLSPVARA